jgi:hypothetical protein
MIKQSSRDHARPERKRTLQALTSVRHDWEELANGKSLVSIESSVGLLLSDIADQLQLTPKERLALLGGKLTHDVEKLLRERVSRGSTE